MGKKEECHVFSVLIRLLSLGTSPPSNNALVLTTTVIININSVLVTIFVR
jgi:hypothetical protein